MGVVQSLVEKQASENSETQATNEVNERLEVVANIEKIDVHQEFEMPASLDFEIENDEQGTHSRKQVDSFLETIGLRDFLIHNSVAENPSAVVTTRITRFTDFLMSLQIPKKTKIAKNIFTINYKDVTIIQLLYNINIFNFVSIYICR